MTIAVNMTELCRVSRSAWLVATVGLSSLCLLACGGATQAPPTLPVAEPAPPTATPPPPSATLRISATSLEVEIRNWPGEVCVDDECSAAELTLRRAHEGVLDLRMLPAIADGQQNIPLNLIVDGVALISPEGTPIDTEQLGLPTDALVVAESIAVAPEDGWLRLESETDQLVLGYGWAWLGGPQRELASILRRSRRREETPALWLGDGLFRKWLEDGASTEELVATWRRHIHNAYREPLEDLRDLDGAMLLGFCAAAYAENTPNRGEEFGGYQRRPIPLEFCLEQVDATLVGRRVPQFNDAQLSRVFRGARLEADSMVFERGAGPVLRGDVLVAIQGRTVSSRAEIFDALFGIEDGALIRLQLSRGDEEIRVRYTRPRLEPIDIEGRYVIETGPSWAFERE